MVSTAVFLVTLAKLSGQLCHGIQCWSRVLQKKNQFQSHVLRLSTSSENTQFSSNGHWIAEKSNTGLRLSSFLNLVAPELFSTQTASKNAVRKGLIRLNGLKALTTDLITNGDIVESYIRSQQGAFCSDFERKADEDPLAFELIRVPVVWEDDHCAVVIKPQGMPVFRTKETTNLAESADRDFTTSLCLQSALPYSLLPVSLDSKLQPLRRPQAVHRLDKGTGGLLLVAKTRPALINLTAQFADRTIKKKYLAIVVGKLSGTNNSNLYGSTDAINGVIYEPLSGQSAETHWHVEPDMNTMSPLYGCITTVNLEPLTGRTHQLRRHMDLLRHPIMGDPGYWFQDGGRLTPFSTAPKVQCFNGCDTPFIGDYPPRLTGRGMFLWSVGISFKHPVSGDSIHLSIPEPDSYKELRDHLSTT